MPDQRHQASKTGKSDGKILTRCRNRERTIRHSNSHGAPRGYGGHLERTADGGRVVDAGVGGGEEHKDGGRDEHGAEGAETLGEPLLLGRRVEEKADAEIAGEVGRLVGADAGKGAA